MGCRSPQVLMFGGPDSTADCGICQGCIRARALTARERQRAWFERNSRRFHHG